MNHLETIREKWERGECCFGTNVQLADAAVTELMGSAGFDFIWLDCEHSTLGVADALQHIRAARGAGVPLFLRVPSGDAATVKPFLELHPAAVIIPRVASVADAEQAVTSCRYPPRGDRGFGPVRGIGFGAITSSDYLAAEMDSMMVILQIEHIDAVAQIDTILDVPGIDSICVGPSDLCGSMGLPGQPEHPDVVSAIEQLFAAARRRGVPFGQSTGFDVETVQQWLKTGPAWYSIDCDWSLLFKSARNVVDTVASLDRD